ncbi:hypothetical protein PENTCL1PPCAC_20958, partial [Pristionchus entomophagus]
PSPSSTTETKESTNDQSVVRKEEESVATTQVVHLQKEMAKAQNNFQNEIYIRFFENLDFASRIKLRLNRRLERLHLCVKNELFKIQVTISSDEYQL